MSSAYIRLFHDFTEVVEPLTMEERGRLVTAMVEFGRTGEVPEALLTGNERILFPGFRRQIERDSESYAARVRQNALNGKKGGRPRKTENNPAGFPETEKSQDKDKDEYQEKEKEEYKDKDEDEDNTVPAGRENRAPAPDEVRDFCRQNGLPVNADAFWNYYQANGWQAGRRPILDWQAKLREWAARQGDGTSPWAGARAAPVNPALNYAQREYREEDFGDDFFYSFDRDGK